ncbi:putative cytochrome b, partial [Chlamydia psittaci 99DC5]
STPTAPPYFSSASSYT